MFYIDEYLYFGPYATQKMGAVCFFRNVFRLLTTRLHGVLTQNTTMLQMPLIRVILCIITSIYQSTNAHIISHKTILKHFKTLRLVSILSDHRQGALFLAKVILQYSQLNSYLQTRCCGSISCCVEMPHLATAPQHIPTQHDMLPQHLVSKYELNCEYCNITLARNKTPWWWSNKIETCRSVLKCFKIVLCEIICAFVGW